MYSSYGAMAVDGDCAAGGSTSAVYGSEAYSDVEGSIDSASMVTVSVDGVGTATAYYETSG